MDTAKQSLPLVYVDIETTGLDPQRHEMYEISLAKDEGGTKRKLYYWIEPQSLELASASALEVGRYHERKTEIEAVVVGRDERRLVAERIATFTAGCHFVGAKPAFDADFIQAFLWDNGQIPLWHHRMIDVESMVIGLLPQETGGRPVGVKDLLEFFGDSIVINPEYRHTAKGDRIAVEQIYARMLKMAYDRARGG